MIPKEVFADQPIGLVFISWKRDGEWHDKSFDTVEEAQAFVDTCENADLYFSPTTYSKPQRKKENVLPSRWLWQDLDEVNPNTITPKPTMAWETSPGRYQALWRLNRTYAVSEIEALNKRLANDTNADHGSWILTKVLRIPDTHNYKYPSAPKGQTLWIDGPIYTPREIPANIQEVLDSEVSGDRSSTLWYMEHELAKAGFSVEEIYNLIKASSWNKFKGRRDEKERLMHEIAIAMRDAPKSLTIAAKLRVITHADIMSNPDSNPRWLIDEWWTRGSHGIIAGEPKSWKSTLAMDMAVSIASGKPFLGQFKVNTQGPVIIVQNENAAWIIRERMAAIATHRGLVGKVEDRTITWPPHLPIYYINNQAFTISNESHRIMLEDLIKEIKPVLLIMDPLYLMFDGDINSAKDLNPALSWLLWLKNEYNLSIVLVHHWRKSQGSTKRGGQRMLGSTTLHGWVESAWYVQSGEAVEIEREFRAAEQPNNIKLKITLNGEANRYSVELEEVECADELLDDVLGYLEMHPKSDLKSIASELGMTVRRLKRALEKLDHEVVCEGKLYSLTP